MEETNLLAPLLLTIAGLMVGAIFKSLFQRTRIPYTVGLFAIGLIAHRGRNKRLRGRRAEGTPWDR